MTVRVAVLASGRGTNLQALIDHFSSLGAHSPAQIELVASNKKGAPALERARHASIAAEAFNAGDDGCELLELLKRHDIELVVLARQRFDRLHFGGTQRAAAGRLQADEVVLDPFAQRPGVLITDLRLDRPAAGLDRDGMRRTHVETQESER